MEYSPWGSEEDPPPISFPSTSTAPSTSPELTFASSSTTTVTSSSGWGDDDGGWGGVTDDYTPGAFGSSSVSGFEATTEDLDEHIGNESMASSSGGGGWGIVDDAADLRSSHYHTEEEEVDSSAVEESKPSPRSRPTTPTPDSYRAATPPPHSSPINISSSTAIPSSESPTTSPKSEKEPEDDWGGYGTSPTLPPLASLSIAPQDDKPIVARDSGWGTNDEEDDWKHGDEPLPLPRMEDMFTSRPKAEPKQEEEEEGWGPPVTATSWTSGDAEHGLAGEDLQRSKIAEEWPSEVQPEFALVKSIPASLVTGLKNDSKKLAADNWTIDATTWGKDGMQEQASGVPSLLSSLLEAPSLPPPSATQNEPSLTSQTPLSSFFRQTPNLYPAFRKGLDTTALRTAETLKGTSSSAYRNARFGRSVGPNRGVSGGAGGDLWDLQSGLGTPDLVSEKGHAGDEFDLDAPGSTFQQQQQAQAAKTSWWGSSSQSSTTSATTTNMPASLLATKKEDKVVEPTSPRPASPAPEPGRLGRLFGRFGRKNASESTGGSGNSPRNSGEWKGDDLGYLEDPPPTKFASAKQEDRQMSSELDDFFGGSGGSVAQSSVTVRGGTRNADGFGGLLDGFSAAPAKTVKPQSARPKDPFDPFGDDEDEEAMASPSVPAFVATPLKSPIRINTSSPVPRTISPSVVSPVPTTHSSSIASFPALAAPQARSFVPVQANDASDSFDSFFSSAVPSPPPVNTVPAISSTFSVPLVPRSVVSPPPRTSTLSPPTRAATISPPNSISSLSVKPPTPRASTASPSPTSFLPPPPPSTQPISRGFNIAPPPPSASSLSRIGISPIATPTTTPPPPVAPVMPKPPVAGKTGALSLDDLSFFEN